MANAPFDLLILNATIIDGTGADRYNADIAISNDRIAKIGKIGGQTKIFTIDAAGKVLSPGFIDVHTHDDHALIMWPDMTYKASQGVTSVVAGNCGISLAPLTWDDSPLPPPLDLLGNGYRFPKVAQFFKFLEQNPPALNAGLLCGHTTLRAGAMDDLTCAATETELNQMREHLQEALDAGALGLSTGLAYAPAMSAPTGEVIALAELLGPARALYTTHLRNEEEKIEEALEEAFEIGRAAGVPVVLSHHKVAGKAQFGRTKQTLDNIEKIRELQTVHLDVYPYHASSTVIRPDRLKHSNKTLITWSKPMPEHAGRDLADVANEMGLSLEKAAEKLMPGGAIYFAMDEQDVQRVIQYPPSMIASDGLPHDEKPHPRLWGTFPRVLGHYSRNLGILPLETAIHKMTGLPAKAFGLTARGTLKEGNFADLTLFDPETIIDSASFDNPQQPADGIEMVFVNGECIYQFGESTGKRPGRTLRRQYVA